MHYTLASYWSYYHALPLSIRRSADNAFALLKENPQHPSLHFKPVGKFWSARVTYNYRALAVKKAEGYYWFWIGSHAEYDRLLSQ
jgi:hypothetical protein